MKALVNEKNKMKMGLVLIASLLLIACGSKKSGGDGSRGNNGGNDNNNGNPPVTDPIVTPTGGVGIELTDVDPAVLALYTGNETFSAGGASDFKIQINLQKFGTYAGPTSPGSHAFDYGYGGYVSVSFNYIVQNPYTGQTTTQAYKDTFESLVNPNGVVETNAKNHRYNLLSDDYPGKNGQTAYHGFFEDRYGAIIVVIDSTNDLGDGQGPSQGNGSVWFKNHGLSYAPLSPTSCWFVSVGPYDCRAWKAGDNVDTKRSLYPDSGYVKLGNFTNLDMKKAFNNYN